jgi:hypothetical protein
VKPDIAMNENAVVRIDRHSLIAFDGASHDDHEIDIVYHAGKAFADPIAPLRPGNPTRQPARHLRFADARVLLREDATERPADPLRQFAISLAALEEAPRIATAGNHLAHLEPDSDTKRVCGTRNEQRSVTKRSTRRSTASRRLPDSGAGNQVIRSPGSTTAHRSSRATI